LLDAFLAEVQEVGVDRLEHVVRMRVAVSRKRRRELVRRLVELLDEYDDLDAGAEPWSLFFAMHPDVPSGTGPTARTRAAR
jgi:hypothetical protein